MPQLFPIAPVNPPVATETLTFTNAFGQSVTFGDGSMPTVIYKGISGIGISPVENFAVDTAYQPGAIFLRTKKKTRQLKVELVVMGDDTTPDSRVSLFNIVDAIGEVLDPQITATGTLVKTLTDGTQRQLTQVQYMGGLEIDDEAANRARVTITLLFEAYDPLWYSTSQHVMSLGAGTDTFGFAVPIAFTGTPQVFVIGNPASGAGVTVNQGNIYSFPVFTFSGPCTNYQIRNQQTGQSFLITQPLFAGDTLIVDTKAGTLTYIPNGGVATPVYSAFAGAKQWVQLAPGANTLTFTRDNATSQQCTVSWFDVWNHG